MTQISIFEEEPNIGQENEEDLKVEDLSKYAEAVLWSTDWTTETIVSQLIKGNIELNPKFQRRDAWTQTRKSSFIESLILGLPIPQIILAERKDKKGSYIVIDGKQRLLSIRQFCASDADTFDKLKLKGLKILSDLNGKFLSSIKLDVRFSDYLDSFENQTIRTTVIRSWPNQDFLYTVFLRLNTGSVPLSPQELRQALLPGRYTEYVDDFSQSNTEIQKALNIKRADYRMRDVEIVIRYYSYKKFFTTYSGNMKDFLDNTCIYFNENWDIEYDYIHKQGEELNASLEATFDIFGKKEAFSKWTDGKFLRLFNRPIFDIMTYYFSVPEIREAALHNKIEVKKAFIELCEGDINFIRSIETTTKNIDNTVKRFYAWGEVLNKLLNVNLQLPHREANSIITK